MVRLVLLASLLLAGCAAAPNPAAVANEDACGPPGLETGPRLSFDVSVTAVRLADPAEFQAWLSEARKFYAELGLEANVVGSHAEGTLGLALSDGHCRLNIRLEALEVPLPDLDRPGEMPIQPARPRPARPEMHAAWTIHVSAAAFARAAALPGASRDTTPDTADTVILVDPLGLMLRVARAAP
ncbi:MAG: hypothetical protein HUU03_12335 [Planctomycetaceae bacterium]|nr:hypothetical protein [Planctomycetaceae bacterium]